MNNSEDRGRFISSCAYIISESLPQFAIPILKTHNLGNTSYLQDIDSRGSLRGVFPIQFDGNTVDFESEASLRIGEPALYSIIGPKKQIIVGRAEELSGEINSWIDQIEYAPTAASFARFSHNKRHLISSWKDIFSQNVNLYGQKRARQLFLEDIVFPEIVRSSLLMAPAENENSILKIMERSNIRIINGEIEFKIKSNKEDENLDYISHALAKLSGYGDFSSVMKLKKRSLSFILERSVESRASSVHIRPLVLEAHAAIENIKSYRRQEDRIGYYMDLMIRDSSLAFAVSDIYKGSAQLERKSHIIINSLVHEYANNDMFHASQFDKLEIAISLSIRKLFSAAYVMQRGFLLYILSQHLGKYSAVSQSIRSVTNRSNAQDVNFFREDILDSLNR